MVLVSFLVAVSLAGVILNLVLSQFRISHHQVSRIQAYYACLAGLNLAYENLRTGTWMYNTTYYINTTTPPCVPAANRICDTDIPFPVTITIGQQGIGGIGNTTPIRATTTYTSS